MNLFQSDSLDGILHQYDTKENGDWLHARIESKFCFDTPSAVPMASKSTWRGS